MRDSVREFVRAVSMAGALAMGLVGQTAPGRGPGTPPPRGGGLLAQAGSSDKHIIDPESAQRGQKIWAAECITCHGASARGGQGGPDLVRSVMVLHDRYGDQIGPFLKKGHQTQTTPSAKFT